MAAANRTSDGQFAAFFPVKVWFDTGNSRNVDGMMLRFGNKSWGGVAEFDRRQWIDEKRVFFHFKIRRHGPASFVRHPRPPW